MRRTCSTRHFDEFLLYVQIITLKAIWSTLYLDVIILPRLYISILDLAIKQ